MAYAKFLEEQKRKELSKKYNDTFRAKHKDKLKQQITCNICNRSYTYYTKSKHAKTKKHIKMLNELPKLEEELEELK